MGLLMGLLVISLFLIFCFRHFFIQLMGLKLLMDVITIFIIEARNREATSLGSQAAATLISSLSALAFFVLMAAGIRRFARSKDASLEVRGD